MSRRPLLGHRLERLRVHAGLTELDAVEALKLSRVDVLRGYERGEHVPSIATLHRIVDVYTGTEHYADNYRLWEWVEEAGDDDLRPPDVALAELLELRERLVAHRRRLRLGGTSSSIVAALAMWLYIAVALGCHVLYVAGATKRPKVAVARAKRRRRSSRRLRRRLLAACSSHSTVDVRAHAEHVAAVVEERRAA